jgi:hypothetical protein
MPETEEEKIVTERLARCLESGDFAPFARAYAPDALFDAHVPGWRFQLEGPEAITGQLRSWWPVQGRLAAWEVTTSEDGYVVVQFERWWRESDDDVNCRQLHRLRVEAGQVVSDVVYCAGKWGPALRAEMAAASPPVRP